MNGTAILMHMASMTFISGCVYFEKYSVLDVFTQEPLPEEHPFWTHPKVVVTAHTAAVSSPEDVASVFVANAKRYIANEALHYQFDFNKGY